jgi:DNA recombination protein RmuC
MDVLLLVIGLVIGAVAGVLSGLALADRRARTAAAASPSPALLAAQHAAELTLARADERAVQSELREQLAAAKATAQSLRESLEREKTQNQALEVRQRQELAAQRQREQTESKVLQALAPVKESLVGMQQKVTELEEQRSRQHGELTQRLRSATESEERLRGTAESLASALRSNSTRGVWGETQLRSVVEAAGLLERVDFDVQSSISTDAGAGRPDMVVHLPGGKSIAVDAKAPFNAFLEASRIPATATGEEAARRDALLKQHVKAVRDHINALGGRTYWAGFDASPELVVAFIPSESLVSAAMEADPTIMEYAFGRHVALASPVTLWSLLKTVAFTWQQDVLTQDAKVLFDLSRELYSRLTTTAGHIDKLGRSIKGAVNDYNKFVGSLERQVLPSARKLNALDESKVIPALQGIEESPRELTAYELVETVGTIGAVEPVDGAEDEVSATASPVIAIGDGHR